MLNPCCCGSFEEQWPQQIRFGIHFSFEFRAAAFTCYSGLPRTTWKQQDRPLTINLTNVIRYFGLLLVGRRILPITIIFMDCHLVPKFPRLCILPLPGDISCSQWMLMLGVDIFREIYFHSVPFKSPSQMKEKLFPCVFKLQPRGNKTVFPLSRHEWGRKGNW